MVKLRRMTGTRRIAPIAGMILLVASVGEAGFWNRKADKPAQITAAAGVTLSSIEVDGSRVLLRMSGAPAYTSYSPSPGVFVVDLTGAAPDPALVIPTGLPESVTTMSADSVVEMGATLTRVTIRLAEAIQPQVAAIDNAVVVTIPAIQVALETVEPVTPDPAAGASASAPTMAMVEDEMPRVETIEDDAPALPPSADEGADLPRARSVRSIGARSQDGNVEVNVQADGRLTWKAFKLENPSRLVIDLDGVKNAAGAKSVAVEDDVVKRVRVAQFQPTVARVVVDLEKQTPYDITRMGDAIRITFGETPMAVSPARVDVPRKPIPEPEPREVVSARSAEEIPVIAENAPAWKMPPPASAGARKVINAQQAPAQQPPPPQQPEDVFSEPDRQVAIATAQNMAGTRTLSGGPRVWSGEPFSLDLKDADIRDVLRMFGTLTGLNIAIDPGVTGSVTVNFTDVPWDQALDLILRQNNLTYTIEGNVMRVGTIDRLMAETAATRRLAEEERLNVPLTTVGWKLSYARASEVLTQLQAIASPRARIIMDQRTNQLIISEIPAHLTVMQNLITTIDIPTPQVMIEARIVESSRTFSQQWGFEWGFGGDIDPALGTSTGLVFPNRVGFDAGPFDFGPGDNIISLTLSDVLGTFNLDLALNAAEAQGFAKIVSAPRVTTQDNQAATIQSGFQIPYQTRVNFTTTVQYLDATLTLTVTPQITDAGTVIMQIAVAKNEPLTGLAIEGAAGTPLTTRTANTRLMVRDGGTAVIAGIYTTRDESSQSRVPFVHNIPVIGALFRTHNINTSHDELLIFITPRIIRG